MNLAPDTHATATAGTDTDLRALERNWDALGDTDPLWAILYDPDRKDNRWRPEEFFATGTILVDDLFDHLRSRGVVWRPDRALDFGCGAGRLTQSLARYFDRVDGVDIAPSMVELARQHNRHGNRCVYHHNKTPDLRRFPDRTFDFVLTDIVLQHMPVELMLRYVSEFVRVLRPGGIACFDIPPGYAPTWRGSAARVAPSPVLQWYRERKHHGSVMELHHLKPAGVLAHVTGLGARVLEDRPLPAGPRAVIARHQYVIQRAA